MHVNIYRDTEAADVQCYRRVLFLDIICAVGMGIALSAFHLMFQDFVLFWVPAVRFAMTILLAVFVLAGFYNAAVLALYWAGVIKPQMRI